MATRQLLFEEFSFALRLPDYFGKNWDALEECLTDMSWLPAEAYALFITDAPKILDLEQDDVFAELVDLLSDVAVWWSRERDHQAPRAIVAPFHVVFLADDGQQHAMITRLQSAAPSDVISGLAIRA